MNKQVIINVVLVISLVIVSIHLVLNTYSETKNETNQLQQTSVIIDNIMTRTSVRSYEDRNVENDKIETMQIGRASCRERVLRLV